MSMSTRPQGGGNVLLDAVVAVAGSALFLVFDTERLEMPNGTRNLVRRALEEVRNLFGGDMLVRYIFK